MAARLHRHDCHAHGRATTATAAAISVSFAAWLPACCGPASKPWNRGVSALSSCTCRPSAISSPSTRIFMHWSPMAYSCPPARSGCYPRSPRQNSVKRRIQRMPNELVEERDFEVAMLISLLPKIEHHLAQVEVVDDESRQQHHEKAGEEQRSHQILCPRRLNIPDDLSHRIPGLTRQSSRGHGRAPRRSLGKTPPALRGGTGKPCGITPPCLPVAARRVPGRRGSTPAQLAELP